jgi:uncharacterized protein (TIGR03067 family)
MDAIFLALLFATPLPPEAEDQDLLPLQGEWRLVSFWEGRRETLREGEAAPDRIWRIKGSRITDINISGEETRGGTLRVYPPSEPGEPAAMDLCCEWFRLEHNPHVIRALYHLERDTLKVGLSFNDTSVRPETLLRTPSKDVLLFRRVVGKTRTAEKTR